MITILTRRLAEIADGLRRAEWTPTAPVEEAESALAAADAGSEPIRAFLSTDSPCASCLPRGLRASASSTSFPAAMSRCSPPRALADYYEEVARHGADPREAASWIMGELLAALKVRQCALADFPVRPAELAELLELLASGTLPRSVARQVFARMMATGHPPARIVEEEGLTQVRDDGAIERWVAEAVEAYRAEAERVLAGEARLLSFFVGQVMRRSGGKANPGQVSRVLRERLR